MPNWLYLTGSLSQLAAVWHHYGIEVEDLPAGAMAAHNDLAFVISAERRGPAGDQRRPRAGHGRHDRRRSPALLADSVLQSMGRASEPAPPPRRAAGPRCARSPPRSRPSLGRCAACASPRLVGVGRAAGGSAAPRDAPRWPPRSRRPPTAGRSCRCRPTPRSGRCSPGRRTPRPGSSSRRRASRTTAGWSRRPTPASSLTVAVRPSQDLAVLPARGDGERRRLLVDRRADQRGRGRLARRARRLRQPAGRAARRRDHRGQLRHRGDLADARQAGRDRGLPRRQGSAGRCESPRSRSGQPAAQVLAARHLRRRAAPPRCSPTRRRRLAAAQPAGRPASWCGSARARRWCGRKAGLTALWRRVRLVRLRAAVATHAAQRRTRRTGRRPRRCRCTGRGHRVGRRWHARRRVGAAARRAGGDHRAGPGSSGCCCRRCPRTPRCSPPGRTAPSTRWPSPGPR